MKFFINFFYKFFFSFPSQFLQKQYSKWPFLYYDCQICPNFLFVQIFLSHHAENNDTNLRKKFPFLYFSKTVIRTLCANCTVTGCPCSNLPMTINAHSAGLRFSPIEFTLTFGSNFKKKKRNIYAWDVFLFGQFLAIEIIFFTYNFIPHSRYCLLEMNF